RPTVSIARPLILGFVPFILASLAVACGSDDGLPRRVITITQTDDGCGPASIELATGEKVQFEVKNDGKKDREIEGVDGTKLEEVLVPSGRTRNLDYTAPGSAGAGKIKCYIPGGNTTIIELAIAGDAKTSAGGIHATSNSLKTTKPAQDTVNVKLVTFEVSADKLSVSKGATKFIATNASKTDVHELAVLREKSDGSFENTGEIEDIDPGKSGEMTLDLPAGKYVLACLIVPGEAGSKEDHFKSGMKRDFEAK
ncbi:MAG: cupredoxin domain-containing protein, partial [Anaerolineaceae bacterium]